jgi:hypothetical protein
VSLVAVCCLLPAACSSDQAGDTAPTASSPVPVPDGVELTDPGSTLEVGDVAIAPYVVSPARASLLAVRVIAIVRGSRGDLRAFSLTPAAARSTPWYVHTAVRVVGEGRLGRAPVPVYGFDSDATYFPAADVQGGLDVCPSRRPPADFGQGDTLRSCLVFFVPPPARLVAVQLRGQPDVEPISWPVPRQPRRTADGPAPT